MERFAVLLVLFMGTCSAHLVTISNQAPKRAVDGTIVNAHDGSYRLIDGFYYYHGAEYGLCKEPLKNGCDQTPGPSGPPYPAPGKCGFQADHNVSIWRSKDLSNWTFVGRAAHCATEIPDCKILYRPHLVYNPNTHKYVLFVNYVTKSHGYGGNAVFLADSPEGPFSLANPPNESYSTVPRPCHP